MGCVFPAGAEEKFIYVELGAIVETYDVITVGDNVIAVDGDIFGYGVPEIFVLHEAYRSRTPECTDSLRVFPTRYWGTPTR